MGASIKKKKFNFNGNGLKYAYCMEDPAGKYIIANTTCKIQRSYTPTIVVPVAEILLTPSTFENIEAGLVDFINFLESCKNIRNNGIVFLFDRNDHVLGFNSWIVLSPAEYNNVKKTQRSFIKGMREWSFQSKNNIVWHILETLNCNLIRYE